MQTFLPYPNFAASAMVLDRQRLNQQCNDARQILSAIQNGGGWRNHPAVRMWRGHEPALQFYHDVMVRDWERRGYASSRRQFLPPLTAVTMPTWLGRRDIHASHRSQLLAKMPQHYGRFGWLEEPGMPYIWPQPTGLVSEAVAG
jgi:hypothetical protein